MSVPKTCPPTLHRHGALRKRGAMMKSKEGGDAALELWGGCPEQAVLGYRPDVGKPLDRGPEAPQLDVARPWPVGPVDLDPGRGLARLIDGQRVGDGGGIDRIISAEPVSQTPAATGLRWLSRILVVIH